MPKPAYRWAYQSARARLVAGHGRCYWCDRDLKPGEGDADHLEGLASPLLVRSCARCNRGRHNRGIPSPGSVRFFR